MEIRLKKDNYLKLAKEINDFISAKWEKALMYFEITKYSRLQTLYFLEVGGNKFTYDKYPMDDEGKRIFEKKYMKYLRF